MVQTGRNFTNRCNLIGFEEKKWFELISIVLSSRINLEPDSKPDSNDIFAFYEVFHLNFSSKYCR